MTLSAALSTAAVLHFYWAGGGDWGLRRSLGVAGDAEVSDLIRPGSALVGGGLLAASGLLLARASIWRPPLPVWAVQKGTWALAGVLLFVALLNFAARTTFERAIIAPTVLSLAALAVVAAASEPRAKAAEGKDESDAERDA